MFSTAKMQHNMVSPYASSNITTELIQKYLDENKQLILAILDNQNLGKLNECATYQAKLQQNLMYLAAIADAQPQALAVGSHHTGQSSQSFLAPAPLAMLPPGQHYMQQQHQHQQLNMMNQRSAMATSYQNQSHAQASQQSFYNPQTVPMMSHDRAIPAPGYPNVGRVGNQMNINMEADLHRGGNGTDLGSGSRGDRGHGRGNDESEAPYLKPGDGSAV